MIRPTIPLVAMTAGVAVLAYAPSAHAIGTTALSDPRPLAMAAIVFGAGSEIIGLLPIRSNSWVQLGLRIGRAVFGGRRS
jgi:hypothetical protein